MPAGAAQNRMSDGQRSLIDLASLLAAGADTKALAAAAAALPPVESEQAAGKYVEQATKRFLARAKAEAPARAAKAPAKTTR